MEDSYEYQIFIGCNDPQSREEVVNAQELKEMVSAFFERKKIDFSLLVLKGGFLHEEGWYETEDSLCINIIGNQELDILRIARSLSQFMNQKCFLIVRNQLKMTFN